METGFGGGWCCLGVQFHGLDFVTESTYDWGDRHISLGTTRRKYVVLKSRYLSGMLRLIPMSSSGDGIVLAVRKE